VSVPTSPAALIAPLTAFFVPALYAAWFRVERAFAPNPPMPSAAAAPARSTDERGQRSIGTTHVPVDQRAVIRAPYKRRESMGNTMKAAVVRELGKPLALVIGVVEHGDDVAQGFTCRT